MGSWGVRGVDSLVDAGNDDGGVAGELARSIDGVFVPGAFGQAFGVEEGLFGVAQSLVESGGARGWCGLGCADSRTGGGEAVGRGEGSGEIEVEVFGGG